MTDPLQNAMDQIRKMFSETPAMKWITSPEVTKWCEDRQREREEEEAA